jgi:diguanylate cyclase (GGDEF)-like protein
MFAVEPTSILLMLAVVALLGVTITVAITALWHGSPHGLFWDRTSSRGSSRTRQDSGRATDSAATARVATREAARELDDVLEGVYATETNGRVIRTMVWLFVLSVISIMFLGQQWQPVQPQIVVTLLLAGASVSVSQKLMPPGNRDAARVTLEAGASIVFLTVLVVLTGNTSSPFFFLYPLIVGVAALIASPVVSLLLAFETMLAFGIVALSGHLGSGATNESLARIGINLTTLVLMTYLGIVIARVQRDTRRAAIRLSTIDSLTCLYNRAFLFNAVEREIQRGRRYQRGFCLLMMDLDGLKAINDRYGHYEGDTVLRGVADAIRSGLRSVDMGARYGGDEFVALLPETDPSGAYIAAENIRQTVNELQLESAGRRIPTSLSIGMAVYPDDGRTADELMIAADKAMYFSKHAGKNRVAEYSQIPRSAPSAIPSRLPPSGGTIR